MFFKKKQIYVGGTRLLIKKSKMHVLWWIFNPPTLKHALDDTPEPSYVTFSEMVRFKTKT